MKKVFYITLFLFGLVAVSCNKQEITPVINDFRSTPVWNSFEDDSHSSNEKSGNSGDDIIDDGTDDGTGITDPNEDTDGDTPIGGDQGEKP